MRGQNLALVWGALVVVMAGCVTPTPRAGGGSDGGARWAFNLAKPSIDPNAKVYQILGSAIHVDGRLPTNTGSWSFVTWNSTNQETRQVTVGYDGKVSTSTRTNATAPSANGQPLATNWADSIKVFDSTATHLACGVTEAKLAVLNVATYPEANGNVAWAINFNTGVNHIVKWDGTYLGPQGAPDIACYP